MAEPTRVARLTPAGRGAVATVAVWGPQAAALVAERFRPHGKWQVLAGGAGAPSVGTWPVGEAREEVVLRQSGPDSFELHCHGGMASVTSVVEGCVAAGAEAADWAEWLARTTSDPAIQAAWKTLAACATERPAAILLDQMAGAWQREMREIEALRATNATAARERLIVLRSRAALGLRLARPFRVVLCGPVNVGKSSLINALLGYPRAIATAEPGTTRDVVSAPTACGGWPVELSDTAGLRVADDPLEVAGIERTRREIAAAELVLWVIDASLSTGPNEVGPPPELAGLAAPVIPVANKCDLPIRREAPSGALRVSATTGEGIERLAAAIAARLVPDPPPAGAAVPITPEQAAQAEAMLASEQLWP